MLPTQKTSPLVGVSTKPKPSQGLKQAARKVADQ